eukprot:s692_g25.t1
MQDVKWPDSGDLLKNLFGCKAKQEVSKAARTPSLGRIVLVFSTHRDFSAMEESSKLLSVCTVETDEEFLSSLDSESSDGDMGYDYIPQRLTGSQRLVRFFEARKYKQSAWTLMLCYAFATTAEFVADNDFREAKMASMGQVARANFCSIAFFAQVLSLLTAVVLSLAAEGSFSFMRRVLTLNRMFHFGLIGIIFLASEGFYLAETWHPKPGGDAGVLRLARAHGMNGFSCLHWHCTLLSLQSCGLGVGVGPGPVADLLKAMLGDGDESILLLSRDFVQLLMAWRLAIYDLGWEGDNLLVSGKWSHKAGQASGAKLWSVVVPHVGIPVAAFVSQLYFKRPYTAMLLGSWMTFSLCTFIALRERYRECPAFSDIRCGSREAVLWIESNMNVRSLIYGFVGMSLNVMASILSERLFHTWKD